MRVVYFLLLALVAVSPVLLFVDGPLVHGLIVAFAAVTVALISASIRPGEAGHLSTILRPVIIICAIIAVWLCVELVPLPKTLAHPIWSDAEAALGRSVSGMITIDPGATIVAICRYFSTFAILFISAAVTLDRSRAERALFWSFGALTVCAVLQTLHAVVSFPALAPEPDGSISATAPALASMGLVIGIAAGTRMFERRYEKSSANTETISSFSSTLVLLGLVICAVCLVVFARLEIGLAAAAGVATFVVFAVVRRLGFGLLTAQVITILAIGAVLALAIVIADAHAPSGDPVLRYASQSSDTLTSITQRMIADTRWAGSGAGTFEMLLPIYREAGVATAGLAAPSAAAVVTIELGRPALLALFAMATMVLLLLADGALQRGRDWYYPAAGAGCLVILMLEAFCDGALFSTTVLICAMVAVGLGISQRVGRAVER